MRGTLRVGDKVTGLGRNGRAWSPRPSGVVTAVLNGGTIIRVQWDDCAVEDDMAPTELARQ